MDIIDIIGILLLLLLYPLRDLYGLVVVNRLLRTVFKLRIVIGEIIGVGRDR